jgi:ribonuclease HI
MGGMVMPVEGGVLEYRPRVKPAPAFTDAGIDQQFRKLYPQLKFRSGHRMKLERRGFSKAQVDYLESIGFRSWMGRTKVSGIDPKLPGMKGDRLHSSIGFGIPAYTPDQRLIGYQIAVDNPIRGGKYVYLPGTTEVRSGKVLLFNVMGLPDYSGVPRSRPEATLYFSGVVTPGVDADGNPSTLGVAGAAAVLTDPTGHLIDSVAKRFNRLSPDQADYNGLLLGLQLALAHGVTALTIAGDNHPVVYQVAHRTPIEEPSLIPLNRLCHQLLEQQGKYQLKRVVTEHNLAAPLARRVSDGAMDSSDRYFDLRQVWLVDGALKAYTTAYRHHAAVIGCPGGLHGSNEADLGRYLALLGAERVVLMPDAGDVINPHTARANRSTIKAVQSLGYSVRVGWWNQVSKPVTDGDPGDIDEIPTGTPISYLTAEEFNAKHSVEVLRRIDEALTPGIQKFDKPVPYPRAIAYREPIRFRPGNALATVQELIRQGHRFSLNTTHTGGGKSFTISQYQPSDFGASQLLWVVDDPVSQEHKEHDQYRGRDGGRSVRPDGRVVRARGDEAEKYLDSNCERYKLSDFLQRKGITPNVPEVCATCPLFEDRSCASTPGLYLHDREQALKSSRLRLPAAALGREMLRDSSGKPWDAQSKHIDPDNDPRKPGAVIFVDDVDPWVSSYAVSLATVKATVAELLVEMPTPLIEAIRVLQQLMGDKNGRRWINRSHPQLIAKLPELNLNPEALTGVYTVERSAAVAESSKMSRIWIQDFVEILQGAKGYLYTYKGELMVNRVNTRFVEAITHPAVIHTQFLDATAKAEHLQQWLKGHVTQQIPVVAQDEPEKPGLINLTQITGLGDLGYNRSAAQKTELESLKAVLNTSFPEFAEVDIKGATVDRDALDAAVETLTLRWRSTSRGSNAAKAAPGLICYGTPRMNLSAAIARYALMTGDTDIDQDAKAWTAYPMDWRNKPGESWGRVLTETQHQGFAEFYHQLTVAEIHQAYGRLRAAIRPGEIVQVLHVTDYPVGLPASTWTTAELMPDNAAVTPATTQVTLEALTTAIEALSLLKRPSTQAEAADYLGVTLAAVVHFIERQPYSWDDIRSMVFYTQPETIDLLGSSTTSTPYIYRYCIEGGSCKRSQYSNGSSHSDTDQGTAPPAPVPPSLPAVSPRKHVAARINRGVAGKPVDSGGKEM